MSAGYPYPGIIVDPQGVSTSVAVTDDTGATATVYSDRYGVSAVVMPQTITAPTTYYVPGEGPWTVTATVDGTALAAKTVTLADAQVATITVPVLSARNTQLAAYAYEGEAPSLAGALPNFMKTVRNYDDFAAATVRIIGLGSSVGLGPDGALDPTNSTTAYLATVLGAWINRLGNMTVTPTNGSVAGSTIASGVATDYAAAKTAAGGVPNLVLLTYGMNEGTPGQYYSGLTLPGVYSSGVQLIEEIAADGADVIVLTTPHVNTATYPFTSYGGPFTYPDGQQKPLLTSAVVNIPNVDGVSVPASYLHVRVNDQLRQLAADTGCVLLDVERYWLQAVAQYGVTTLFGAGQTVHPNLLGFQQSFFKAINDFVTSLKRPTVRNGVMAGQRSGSPSTVLGLSGLSVASGGTFTIPLPAGTSGRIVITGSSGGGWHSVWEGVYVALAGKCSITAVGSSFAEAGQVVSSVTASGVAPQLTVTAVATGSGCNFAWSLQGITGS